MRKIILAGAALLSLGAALPAYAQAVRTDIAPAAGATTGATLVITTSAEHAGDDWVLDATLLRAGGGTQVVSARAADPVVAATALARNLRELLSPAGASADCTAGAPPSFNRP